MANPHPFAILKQKKPDSGIPHVSLAQRDLVLGDVIGGNDELISGGDSDDTLFGDFREVDDIGGRVIDGDDVLEGGAGNDDLWGDTMEVNGNTHVKGEDEFVFVKGEGGVDTIWDFDDGLDEIVMDGFTAGDITSIGIGTVTASDAVIMAGTQTIVVKGLAGAITLDDIEFV